MLKWFLISVLVQPFWEWKKLCWSQGSYYDGQRVGQHRAGGGWAVLHPLPKHSNPCGIAAMESPILLLDEAQRMQLNFLSQVQQSMAVCCCILIHKPNGSDIGMVPSESKHGPFHTLILVLSSVLCHQCIKDKFSESSSVSYFFEIKKCLFFCEAQSTPDFIIFHIFVISIKHYVFSFIIASLFRW